MSKELTVSGVLGEAWKKYTNNLQYIYYLMAPVLALSLLAGLAYPEAAFDSMRHTAERGAMLSYLLGLLSMIIGVFVTISLLFFFQSGKKDTWASWTEYFPLVLKYIGVSILQGLMVLAGLILLIIPGIYLALRYAFVGLRTLEHPTESIKDLFAAEARATEGNRLTLLGIILILFLAAAVLSGIVATVFSVLLGSYHGTILSDFFIDAAVTPFAMIVSIVAYLHLTRGKSDEPVEAVIEEKAAAAPLVEVEPEEPSKNPMDDGAGKKEAEPVGEPEPAPAPVADEAAPNQEESGGADGESKPAPAPVL